MARPPGTCAGLCRPHKGKDSAPLKGGAAAELATLDSAAPVDTAAMMADVERRAADLWGLRRRHPAQARQVLRLVLGDGRFQCAPFDDARRREFDVKRRGRLRALVHHR